jgi:NADP-dependent 3-hydroxy acid dehydrogenase YdfG
VNAPADMADNLWVVTAAGGGIGKAMGALSEAGATVVLVARRWERSQAALAEVRERTGSDTVETVKE